MPPIRRPKISRTPTTARTRVNSSPHVNRRGGRLPESTQPGDACQSSKFCATRNHQNENSQRREIWQSKAVHEFSWQSKACGLSPQGLRTPGPPQGTGSIADSSWRFRRLSSDWIEIRPTWARNEHASGTLWPLPVDIACRRDRRRGRCHCRGAPGRQRRRVGRTCGRTHEPREV